MKEPGQFDRMRRSNCYRKHDGKCIDFIFGFKDGKSEIQAMRYKKKAWTETDAKAHCKDHDGKFETAKER